MQVELITDNNDRPIGYSMQGENKEEIDKLAQIRDMTFFGYGDTCMRYNGRKGGDAEKGNPGTLSWIQHKYSSDKK